MSALLKLSSAIDWINEHIGKLIMWLVLGSVLISAGNAIVRKIFDTSSNSLLEIQWYLFAGVFMLGAGYVFLRNAHVRIDFISARLSKRANAIIDTIGILAVVMPFCVLMINLSWPVFHNAYASGEMSQNAGGLIRWPVYFLMPAGFALLLLQSASELIKRIAFLNGAAAEPFSHVDEKTEAELLAEEMAREAALKQTSAKQ